MRSNIRNTTRRSFAALLGVALLGLHACDDDDNGNGTDPDPAFTLTLSQNAVELAPGESQSITVTIARTGGFSGPITVTTEGVPEGVDVETEAVIPDPGTTATLTFTADEAAEPTSGAVTVRGAGAGVDDETAQVTVTVTEGDGNGNGNGGEANVAWTFCPATGLPDWVAFRDDVGDWTRVEATEDEYAFRIEGERGGVAWVSSDEGGDTDLQVFYGTLEELQQLGTEQCDQEAATAGIQVQGTVAGVPDEEENVTRLAQVTLGSASATVFPSVDESFTLVEVEEGPRDLVAALTALTEEDGEDPTSTLDLERIIIRRALDPGDAGTLDPLDFSGDEAFEPISGTITLEGLDGDRGAVVSGYRTAGGTTALFYPTGPGTDEATHTYFGVPEEERAEGDLHVIVATAFPAEQEEDPDRFRTVSAYTAEAGDVTVAFGPELTEPTVEAGETAGTITLEYDPQAEYDRFWVLHLEQDGVEVSIQATAAYLEGDGTLVLEIPDLSAADGWLEAWGFQEGTPVTWTFTGIGWEGEVGIISAPWEDGGRLFTASRQGQITP